MKSWRIYEKEDGAREIIKEGFNGYAGAFTCFWALSQGLFLQGLLSMGLVLAVLQLALRHTGGLLCLPLLMLYCGWRGNAWLSARREKEGYRMSGLVDARNRNEALLRFETGRQATSRAAPHHA